MNILIKTNNFEYKETDSFIIGFLLEKLNLTLDFYYKENSFYLNDISSNYYIFPDSENIINYIISKEISKQIDNDILKALKKL